MILLLITAVHSENCDNLTTDISLDIDNEPYINEINSFFGILPEAYRTTELKCWSYVYKDNNIQQVNPQKTEYSGVKLPLFKHREETREYFTSENGVVNAYFTYKNLVAYTTFVLGVKCSLPDNTELIGEKCITPVYKEVKEPVVRGIWFVENAEMLFILFLVLLIVVMILSVLYRRTKRLF